jgi:hypothetical protein
MKENLKIENIYCVGRNFEKHAKELGNKVPQTPLIFQKSTSTLNTKNKIEIPKNKIIEHELEIVILIGKAAHRRKEGPRTAQEGQRVFAQEEQSDHRCPEGGAGRIRGFPAGEAAKTQRTRHRRHPQPPPNPARHQRGFTAGFGAMPRLRFRGGR